MEGLMIKWIVLIFYFFSLQSFAFYNMHKNILNNNYKICIIGDAGDGSQTQIHMGKLLAKEGCHQVRILGDIIYPSGLNSTNDIQFFEKFYTPFKPVINSMYSPTLHLILGNHDYEGNPVVWTHLHNKFHYLFSPALQYVELYDHGNICFFNLDTNVFNNYSIKNAYKHNQWMEKQLEGHHCKLKLAFGHHPYKSSGQHGNATGLLKYFLKNQVIGKMDAYFSAHDHQLSYEGKLEGTELFISGSFAKSRKVKESALYSSSSNGYLVLTINKHLGKYNLSLHSKILKDNEIINDFDYEWSK
jgi:tartrate-resistant acid phosphatase type 5